MKRASIFLLGALTLVPALAGANMMYTPWMHELEQRGQDVVITVSIFEESSEKFIIDDVPFPGLDEPYTLTCWGASSENNAGPLFENRVFDPGEAVEVTERICHTWDEPDPDDCSLDPGGCAECDDDNEDACAGFCAVAYRFEVVHECVEPDQHGTYYTITTPSVEGSGWHGDEGLGHAMTVVEDTGDRCLDDGSCSVTSIGRSDRVAAGTALLMLLIGIGAMVLGRRSGR